MLQIDVVNWKKQKQSQVDLLEEVFACPERKDLWHRLVRWQLASRRQGSHKAKTKGEVSGGGKKPFRQKGTGNARQGSSRSPLNEAGGVIFAPRVRDYSYSLPKKLRRMALRSALSAVYGKGRLFVLDKMEAPDAKAKELSANLTGFFNSADKQAASSARFNKRVKVLMVDDKPNKNMQRASANLEGICYYGVEALNVYDVLKYDNLVLTQQAVQKIHQRLAPQGGEA